MRRGQAIDIVDKADWIREGAALVTTSPGISYAVTDALELPRSDVQIGADKITITGEALTTLGSISKKCARIAGTHAAARY